KDPTTLLFCQRREGEPSSWLLFCAMIEYHPWGLCR
uniref:Uncharacterized protein n=1 Tax=Aegilops tauschii subsp. strangulata TaxID=200361 RepID=A0A453NJA8_AEGTS